MQGSSASSSMSGFDFTDTWSTLVLLLLFGASRLPKLFNNIGKSITAFNEGRKELENDKKD